MTIVRLDYLLFLFLFFIFCHFLRQDVPSLAIALGTPVRLIQISNQPITWLQLSAFTHLDMLKPGWSDLSDFGLSISEKGDVLGCCHTTISKFTENGPKARKQQWAAGRHRQRSMRMDTSQLIKATVSPASTRRSSKQMGFSSPHRGPLLSAKNRKQKLQLTNTHQKQKH